MIIICIRTLILYLTVLFALRIMGKSELSEVSTFQMVILFMIAELASIPIDSPTSSLINGVVAICMLLFLQVFISYISIKSEFFKNLINGKPSMIIDKGMINVKEMERLRISVNELLEHLRIANCASISDVECAVMESNGQLSVIAKKDMEKLPSVLISDGYVYESNLKKAGIDYNTLLHMLEKKGIKDVKKVFVAFYDSNRKFHVFPIPENKESYSKEVF